MSWCGLTWLVHILLVRPRPPAAATRIHWHIISVLPPLHSCWRWELTTLGRFHTHTHSIRDPGAVSYTRGLARASFFIILFSIWGSDRSRTRRRLTRSWAQRVISEQIRWRCFHIIWGQMLREREGERERERERERDSKSGRLVQEMTASRWGYDGWESERGGGAWCENAWRWEESPAEGKCRLIIANVDSRDFQLMRVRREKKKSYKQKGN